MDLNNLEVPPTSVSGAPNAFLSREFADVLDSGIRASSEHMAWILGDRWERKSQPAISHVAELEQNDNRRRALCNVSTGTQSTRSSTPS